MRTLISLFAIPLIFLTSALSEEWVELFDGESLHGWEANTLPASFSIVDGQIRAQAVKTPKRQKRAHLFFVGDDTTDATFKNFELETVVRGKPGSNSGIFFHTDPATRDTSQHLATGYEVQLNSSKKEKRKTGSLYAVVDLAESPVDESQWFTMRIVVKDQTIRVYIDASLVVDYTEPPNVERPEARKGRRIAPEGGAIALQAHDPKSTFFFKSIRIKRLP